MKYSDAYRLYTIFLSFHSRKLHILDDRARTGAGVSVRVADSGGGTRGAAAADWWWWTAHAARAAAGGGLTARDDLQGGV
jgi:hypothetical protein